MRCHKIQKLVTKKIIVTTINFRKSFLMKCIVNVGLRKTSHMKKIYFAFLLTAFFVIGKAQVNLPAASPTETISQEFGMGKIDLVYSRPSIKGRTVFAEGSDLAPLGKLWRTGANAATRLTFSDFVNIGNKDLDSGAYVLYTIPGKTEWEIIINKGVTNWGTGNYTESQDVVHLKVPVVHLQNSFETFTMQFTNIKSESCDLNLMWANTMVTIPIVTHIKDRLRTQIENQLAAGKTPYQEAATFYYEWDKDYAKALANVNKGIELNKDAFWLYLLKANIQKSSGDKAGAKQSAEQCIQVATAQKNDEYAKRAQDLIKTL